MSTMKDLARVLAMRNRMTINDSETFVKQMIDVIRVGLNEDGLVKIKGLGTFKLQHVRERESVDVNTGRRVIIGSHDRITFTPDNTMKESINKPFAHFETVILNDGVTFDDTPDENANEIDDTINSDTTVADVPVIDTPVEEVTVGPTPMVAPEPAPAPAVEQEPAVEQAPAIEPTPVVESTPVAEPTPVSEPTPAVEQEPVEPIPAVEQEPVAEPAPEVVNEPAETQSVAELPSDNQPEVLDDEEPSRPWLAYLGIAALAIVMFAVGFFVGANNPDLLDNSKTETSEVKPAPAKVIADSLKTDTASTVANDTIAAPKVQQTVQTPETQTPAPAEDYKKYYFDARVRTGAYAIVGQKAVHVVKQGETFEKICYRYLGPGLNCYVEAYNGGIKEATPGATIKIPLLKSKKVLGIKNKR